MYLGICWETFQASSKRAFVKSFCKAVQISWGCRGITFSLVLLAWPCRSCLPLFLAKELRLWLSLPWHISGTWTCQNWCKIFYWNCEDCHWRQPKRRAQPFLKSIQRAGTEWQTDKQSNLLSTQEVLLGNTDPVQETILMISSGTKSCVISITVRSLLCFSGMWQEHVFLLPKAKTTLC